MWQGLEPLNQATQGLKSLPPSSDGGYTGYTACSVSRNP